MILKKNSFILKKLSYQKISFIKFQKEAFIVISLFTLISSVFSSIAFFDHLVWNLRGSILLSIWQSQSRSDSTFSSISENKLGSIYVTECVVKVNRTSSMPILFFNCLWIKFSTSVWNSPATQCCFPNKDVGHVLS